MTQTTQTTQELWRQLERENLPDLVLNVPSANALVYDDKDLLPPKKTEMSAEDAAKLAAERERVCSQLPWWECNAANTQAACGFREGRCRGEPVAAAPRSYLEDWLRVHTLIYEPMGPPEEIATIITKPKARMGRRRSISRDTYV